MTHPLEEVRFSKIVSIRDRLLASAGDPLRLESGEPSFDAPAHVKQAVIDQVLTQPHKTHYPPSAGLASLREAIVRKAKRASGFTADVNKVIVVNGGMHGLYTTLASVAEKGDRILIPNPNWGATKHIQRSLELNPSPVDLVEGPMGYTFDLDKLREGFEQNKPAAMVVNSPHNPTGGVVSLDELKEVVRLCIEHDTFLIADEAYEDIYYTEERPPALGWINEEFFAGEARIASVYTFSKSYSMTGWRLGYIITNDEKASERIRKMVLYSSNGISTLTQTGGIAALEGPQECVTQFRDAYRERRDILMNGIHRSGFLNCTTPQGAFYVHAHFNPDWKGYKGDTSSSALCDLLIDTWQLGCVPGSFFNAKGEDHCIRFSYGCSTKMVRDAAEILADELPKLV
ncbi:pyridoxal phosphate-dependent aminotransferase [bacterium]|nr:pyridoxal phosphate-dependent aminotransferase [bacterium]